MAELKLVPIRRQYTKRKGLLPCPHCGGKAGLYDVYSGGCVVQCDKCGATTMVSDEDEVKERWNRRVWNGNAWNLPI